MAVDRASFQKFLTDQGVEESLVFDAMSVLEGCFHQGGRAENGFEFGPEPDASRAKEVIEFALRRRVRRVDFVSVADPLPVLDCLGLGHARGDSDAGAGRRVRGWLRGRLASKIGVGERMSDLLWNAFLYRQPPDSFWQNLREVYLPCLGHGLSRSFHRGLENRLWDGLRDRCEGSGVSDGAFYYAAHVLTGNHERVMHLAPLIRFNSQNPILGEKADRPGVWIGLKA